MADPQLKRQLQMGVKVETTAGTYNTPINTDFATRVYVGAAAEHDWPSEPRLIARAVMANLGALPSTKATNINFRAEINTSDTVTADLEYKQALQGTGHTITEAGAIAIDTPASETYFERGETVADATGYQAIVLVPTESGSTRIIYDAVSTDLSTAETLTGGTSGATVTSTGAGAAAGHIIDPISDNQKTVSVDMREDGYHYSAAGCMGNLVMAFENSKAAFFDFSFQGPKNDSGDQALMTDITYQTEQPPIWQGANLSINGVTVVVSAVNVDLGNTVVNRPDANASGETGFIAAYISARDPKVTITFENLPESDLDIYGLMAAGTKIPLQWQVGTAAGKTIYFFADLAQITSISMGDQDGLSTVDVEFSLTGTAATAIDDDYQLVLV